jgi:hypothetical protein
MNGQFYYSSVFCFVNDCLKSPAKINSNGDRGSSPCPTPHLQWKTFPGVPFKIIEEVPENRIF